MKTILAATDLSSRSDRAIERAVSLAQQHKARLVILHIVDEDLSSEIAERRKQEAETAIRDHLTSIMDIAGLDFAVQVVFGKDFVDILGQADEQDADLIVLGMHREGRLRDLFVGTTVERVARYGTRPVLVVRDRVRHEYCRVMIAIDLSVCSRRALDVALDLVPDGEFDLVHAFEVPFPAFLSGRDTRREVTKEHQDQVQRMVEGEVSAIVETLKGSAPSLHPIVRQGETLSVILREVERQHPDLLVVGTHGRTGVAHAILGSIAEALLRDPPCDVLAVPGR
jgi:nucleotide-binding universal stress UspA family protein